MRVLLTIACLVLASPAFSQTRIYTKADLGQPLSSNRPTVTPEQWASLVAHQFRAPVIADGPAVIIIGTTYAESGTFPGPFGAFPPIPPPRRLDGTTFDMPPWSVSTYLGHGRFGYGFSGYGGGRAFVGPGDIGDRRHRFAPRDVPARASAPTAGRDASSGGSAAGRRR